MSRKERDLAVLAARAAEDKKGERIVLRHLLHSSLAEYLLLVTVHSPAQMEAVEERVQERLEEKGAWTLHKDGGASALWRVLDFGSLLVHIMLPEARELYGLDRLYHDARAVSWEESPKAARA